MSGIFGCWAARGSPLTTRHLLACLAPLAHSGLARRRVGAMVRSPLGANLPVAPGSAGGRRRTRPTAPTCVFDGRLDDSRRTAPPPRRSSTCRPDCGDAQSGRRGLRRDSGRFVRHLDGDFSLALFDSRLNRLFLARDRLGIRPLCYTRTGGTVPVRIERQSHSRSTRHYGGPG